MNKGAPYASLVALIVLSLSGCSQSEHVKDVRLGSAEQSVTIADRVLTLGVGFNETAAAYVPDGTLNGTTAVVAYNTNTVNGLGWNFWDGVSGVWSAARNGLNWPTLTTLSDGVTPFGRWAGDPGVAATGRPREVIFTQMAYKADKSKSDVVMGISINGGATVTSLGFVSTPSTGPTVDYPRIAADPVNHVIYVLWRGTGHGWLRAFTFSGASGNYVAGSPILLDTLIGANLDALNSGYDLVIKPPAAAGQSALLAIIYPDGPGSVDCTTSANQTSSVTWRAAFSSTPSTVWGATKVIHTDTTFKNCIGPNQANQNNSLIRGAFDVISGYLLTINSETLRDVNNRNVGTRTIIRQTADQFNTFHEWYASCSATDLRLNLKSAGVPSSEPACDQFAGAIATTKVDVNTSRAGMTWHTTMDSTTPCNDAVLNDAGAVVFPGSPKISIYGASLRPGLPVDAYPATESRILKTTSTGAWCQYPSSGNSAWGDYEGLAGSAYGTSTDRFLAGLAYRNLPSNPNIQTAAVFFTP